MATCKVDSSSSPTFKGQFKGFVKKHRKLPSDLDQAVKDIASDYENACNAARVSKRSEGHPPEVWKYDVGCTDLNRSARNAFRAIGIFLEARTPQNVEGRTMYLLLWYWKGDKSDYDARELEEAVKQLKATLAANASLDEDPGETQPNS